jgi:hypothetical protein
LERTAAAKPTGFTYSDGVDGLTVSLDRLAQRLGLSSLTLGDGGGEGGHSQSAGVQLLYDVIISVGNVPALGWTTTPFKPARPSRGKRKRPNAGAKVHHFHIEDGVVASHECNRPGGSFDQAVQHQLQCTQCRVLVSCDGGINRSAAVVVAAALMADLVPPTAESAAELVRYVGAQKRSQLPTVSWPTLENVTLLRVAQRAAERQWPALSARRPAP